MVWAVAQRKDAYELFLKGAKEGMELTIKIFPTLVGIFLLVGIIRSSGIIDFASNIISPITKIVNIPTEIIPLVLIKPISGSAAIGVATDIMNNYGVDSYIGRLASIIMGSTETTIYVIALYTNSLKIKKGREVLVIALIADLIGVLSAIFICGILK